MPLEHCRDEDKLKKWGKQIREETRRQEKRERRRQRQQRMSTTQEVISRVDRLQPRYGVFPLPDSDYYTNSYETVSTEPTPIPVLIPMATAPILRPISLP